MIGNQGTNLVSALFLSVVLHGAWLLLSEESTRWERVKAERSNTGERRRLDILLRSVEQPEITITADQTLVEPPLVAGGRQVEPLVGATPAPTEKAGSPPDTAGEESGAVRGDYLPRSALSVPPVPLQEIVVPWPGDLAVSGRLVVVFVLFIDEFGFVREVVDEDRASSPAIEEAMRKAFSGALFAPGRIDGRPVRSRIRIEASFESGPAPQPPAIISIPRKL